MLGADGAKVEAATGGVVRDSVFVDVGVHVKRGAQRGEIFTGSGAQCGTEALAEITLCSGCAELPGQGRPRQVSAFTAQAGHASCQPQERVTNHG